MCKITKEWLENIEMDWRYTPPDYSELGVGRYCQHPVKSTIGISDCGAGTGHWLDWVYYPEYDMGMYVCKGHLALVEGIEAT